VENVPVIKKGESLPAVEIGIHRSRAHRTERQVTSQGHVGYQCERIVPSSNFGNSQNETPVLHHLTFSKVPKKLLLYHSFTVRRFSFDYYFILPSHLF
jgi:hypothetical protein